MTFLGSSQFGPVTRREFDGLAVFLFRHFSEAKLEYQILDNGKEFRLYAFSLKKNQSTIITNKTKNKF
jgi:hypothetical protein